MVEPGRTIKVSHILLGRYVLPIGETINPESDTESSDMVRTDEHG